METTIKLFFAGLGPMLWHWGIGVGLIIICILLEMFSSVIPVIGPFLGRFRKDLLWLALAIAVFLCAEWIGGQDERGRCDAKVAVVVTTVDDAIAKSKTFQNWRDKWDTDQ